ncbi:MULTISPECIES: tRNA (adenosine(37)-N6)-threonylcarbamoyltransferase complex ATPase subunit type 1 TsaE [Flavobacterium]|uniref:tRNA threonylcarbamoyladenosine biosynthesis protein TsaE n=1 Tax=Flavobacterium tructae TaxID=1114873 RepID=A0A1S1J326_9FLAO|nr:MULTISPECIES: tRNA (adenosine(37)-N6)-threonylcarbamoyltransferase complex ATPase subunit type 1 TsaE [Flavobacterium]OHT44168.1 tRNA (adenosine(37)-N6)-threonylcarbamoyltransferase complex ATPase subunit type 1 TsaE [Flavobacterium tructae]OXB20080.1 tRNA (adenosine(37)-N6)-threonylcarbamoyltransferase complex ATPase subunit type 1 TsaE [Flavobacterium tructae]OXB23035.1 tRNA (adenosine(37)-N6)-threonylcarbamoyltransferase complex ATPase subunit type 1 TsaE [Flavobacterium tructae]
MNIVFSLDQIKEVATQILAANPKKIILFNGEMGVGKTTLIKQLCKNLGVQDATSSPTFSLVNEYYTSDNQIVYHFDFYRLNKETEALDMGVDDYLYSGNWCFIEWSEKIASLLPEETSTITIELLADGKRELKLS